MTERLKRSEVPVEQTWDLSDLFTSHNKWENELQSIQNDVQEVTKFRGKLGEDAETLLNCLTTLADFQKRVIRVATYASLRSNADGSDPENQRDSAKVASALASIGAKLSFIESELRSEEHTSELQSRGHLVCRLLLEK